LIDPTGVSRIVNLSLPFRRRRTSVSRDEIVVFYPTYGYRSDGSWRLAIQGCVFHSRVTWLGGRPMLGLIRRAMRVERGGDEFFRRRMRQFLVNNSVGRLLKVRAGDCEAVIGPSEAVGLLFGELTLPAEALATYREPTTPHVVWAEFEAVLPGNDPREFRGRAQLLEPHGVSIISDVDDTLKHSNVPNRRDLFHNTFVREFRVIPGMPELYQACAQRGAAFHYVSASPWQLFEPLAEFWANQGYPQGSFHLKRFRLRETAHKMRRMSPQKAHKRAAIEPILQAYPQRQFVLVGDSGEQDPEIYASLLSERPQQIAHVLIRSLRGRAVDATRVNRAFAACPADRWTLYEDPQEIGATILQTVERSAELGGRNSESLLTSALQPPRSDLA
jgi:phosphatidate phosphatase APP1